MSEDRIAYLNARLLDPDSGLDTPGALLVQDGRIAGAGLDVLEQEPPDPDDPILTLDNAIITPHALCWTDQLFAGSGAADVAAVMALMAGKVPRGIVNKEIVDSPKWQQRLDDYRSRFGT